ncbi:snurportin-1-like isoform X3 [Glycine soja]|uniref:Snurportin-1 n=1 Tax=Glycine soja TaxID=3848 RepID=A0A445L2I2_GLYSO|nr:snurportin-1-like isoform X3 [Glycine soja]RZC17367.1 Snurportin-1 isoform B [Glycine soja]
MAPHDLHRPFKRPAISDQERRREQSLLRQAQNRQDAQRHARFLASAALSLPPQSSEPESEPKPEPEFELAEFEAGSDSGYESLDVIGASKLKAVEARKWFAKQLMLPEWMIDIPNNLAQDWFVFARPSGKRCFVVSYNGTTISRLRNGAVLHRFPSGLPSGARKRDPSYSILDCIFHEADQTYYVIDMVCWRGYPLSDCTAEFRFFWLTSKLAETDAFEPPSHYHKHAHYQAGITPLALVWKDENCSQYVLDTDSKGQVPNQQQVVLELQDDGKLTTSDDPPMLFGCLDGSFIQQSGLHSGCLLRFSIGEGGLVLMDGKLEKADLHYLGKANRARASADSFSKVMFQHSVRHSPLRIDGLLESVSLPVDQESKACDIEMDG